MPSIHAPDRSSWLHLVSAQNWCKSSQPTLVCPYLGDHRRMLFMSLSLLFQQYPVCLVHLTLKDIHFTLSKRSDFHMIYSFSIAVHTFLMCMLTLLSVDAILLLRYMNWSANFRNLLHEVEMAPFYLKHMNSDLSVFT